MKGQVTYVKGHAESEQQAEQAYKSLVKRGWDVAMVEGVTPETLDDKEMDVPLLPGGRLIGFNQNEPRKYAIKKSCLTNHYRFYKKVIEADEPMAFFEHDAIACGRPQDWDFQDLLVLNMEYAFLPPTVFGTMQKFGGYKAPLALSPKRLPSDYPLQYYKENAFKGYNCIPGTAAYAITPRGAKKMMESYTKYGLDQSDFQINDLTVTMEYILPSPIKFNTVNLNTSHNL